MADPTNPVELEFQGGQYAGRVYHEIKDTEALVIGGHVSLNASTGKLEFTDATTANLVPLGVVIGQLKGDNQNLTGNTAGDYSAVARGSLILKASVTGASAITDATKPVYASDGQTFTLTAGTNETPIGEIISWISSTSCYVYIYSQIESRLRAQMKILAGGQSAIWPLGYCYVGTNALQGNAAADLIKFTATRAMVIDSLHAACAQFDNAAIAGDQDLNLDIGGTNTTGGVLTLGFANVDATGDLGTQIDATAITAANTVAIGDVVKLELVAGGTGFTADTVSGFHVWANVTLLPEIV